MVKIMVKNGKAQVNIDGKTQVIPANGASTNYRKFLLKTGKLLVNVYAQGDASATLGEVEPTRNSHKFAVNTGVLIASAYLAKRGHKIAKIARK